MSDLSCRCKLSFFEKTFCFFHIEFDFATNTWILYKSFLIPNLFKRVVDYDKTYSTLFFELFGIIHFKYYGFSDYYLNDIGGKF